MTNPVPYRVRQLPLVGPWAARIGRTVDIWGSPCDPDPWVMVLAAWVTIPRMLILAIKPSAIEYGRSRFGRKHGLKPKIKLTAQATIPGIGIPIRGQYSWMLFRLSGVGAAILQYIQFIDIGTTGLLQWSSMVYQYAGCRVPNGGYGSQQQTIPVTQLGAFSGTPLQVPTTISAQNRCIGGAFGWSCDSSLIWSAQFTINSQDIPGQRPANAECYLTDAGGNPIGQSNWTKKNGPGEYSHGSSARFDVFGLSPSDFRVYYKSDWSFTSDGGNFSVVGGPRQNFLKPDP